MAKDIPYYFADTGINGEVLGEQNVYSLPLVNSVLTSNPLNITINKTPRSSSVTYLTAYDNPELGPSTDNNSINRNEILQLSVIDTLFNVGVTPSTPLIITAVKTSSLSKIYWTAYNNPELGPNTDKTGQYRNTIFEINDQRQYRYLIQDSTGSNYPVDNRYDVYYNNTKVILNFDSLTNQAFTNLSVLSSGSFQINDGPTPSTSSYITNSVDFITIGAGGGAGGPDGGSNACGGGSGALISGSINSIFSGSEFIIYVGGGGGGGVGCVTGTGGGTTGSNGGGAGGNAGATGCSGGGGGGGGWSGIMSSSNYIVVAGGGSGGGGSNEGGANDSPSAGGGVQNNGANGTSLSGGNGDAFSGDGGGWAGGGGGYYGGAKQNTTTGANSGGGNYTGSLSTVFVSTGSGVGQGSTAPSRSYDWFGLSGSYGAGGAPIIGSSGTAGSGGNGVVSIRYSGPQKANGGIVTTTGSYTVHTFTTSATMSFYNSPYLVPTAIGYGFFNGSGSFLRITGSPQLNLGSGSIFDSQFTVEYDFYTYSSSNYQTILSRGGGTTNYNTSSGLVYNSGISASKLIWEYYTNNSSSYLLTGSSTINNQTWYNYAVTYDGNITRLYLNGNLENYVCSSIYNYPSTLTSSLTSSFIGRLVSTGSNDFAGYLDKIRISTGVARYITSSYATQSLSYPSSNGFVSGSFYCNSNILNIRFVSGSLTGSNLILPSGSNDFTGSQDVLITNITGTVDNSRINTISTGSNIIRRDDGSTSETIYTGDNYFSDTTILTKGNVERITIESSDVTFNSLSDPSKNYSYKGTGSTFLTRNDGITDKTIYLGDGYLSSATINTIGNIDRIVLQGSNVVINTDTNNFIPSVSKTFTYEVDYNFMFNQEIDSLLTIVTAYSLPTGFSVSSDGKRIVGYVNFTDTKTIKIELSDSSTYNIVLKPIFYKKKYTY